MLLRKKKKIFLGGGEIQENWVKGKQSKRRENTVPEGNNLLSWPGRSLRSPANPAPFSAGNIYTSPPPSLWPRPKRFQILYKDGASVIEGEGSQRNVFGMDTQLDAKAYLLMKSG
jgi:hypothetical protein